LIPAVVLLFRLVEHASDLLWEAAAGSQLSF